MHTDDSDVQVMDNVSAQLHHELRAAVTEALSSRRPILHHLNDDTSWLLQIPRPVSASRRGGRFYFNILIDPWLAGGQSDVAKWFSQQWHATESKVGSIAAVEELLHEVEALLRGPRPDTEGESSSQDVEEHDAVKSFIDVVAISHEFSDHCHKDTLIEVHSDVPVLATEKAAKLIRSWSHFRTVLTTPQFTDKDSDWHTTSISPLPDWLGISRMVTKGDTLYYHSALLITFNNTAGSPMPHAAAEAEASDEDAAEAVIYTPHGIQNEDLAVIAAASPPIHTLAFLHGLHDISIGSQQQLNLGAHNGLKAQRVLNAKYWISTHDEQKKGGGLVSWFLRRKTISIGDALKEERARESNGDSNVSQDGLDGNEVLDSFKDANWVNLGNGESRILV